MKNFQPIRKNVSKEKTVISIRIDEATVDKIDRLSGEIDISRNEFIMQCIQYAINNMNKKKTEK